MKLAAALRERNFAQTGSWSYEEEVARTREKGQEKKQERVTQHTRHRTEHRNPLERPRSSRSDRRGPSQPRHQIVSRSSDFPLTVRNQKRRQKERIDAMSRNADAEFEARIQAWIAYQEQLDAQDMCIIL